MEIKTIDDLKNLYKYGKINTRIYCSLVDVLQIYINSFVIEKKEIIYVELEVVKNIRRLVIKFYDDNRFYYFILEDDLLISLDKSSCFLGKNNIEKIKNLLSESLKRCINSYIEEIKNCNIDYINTMKEIIQYDNENK